MLNIVVCGLFGFCLLVCGLEPTLTALSVVAMFWFCVSAVLSLLGVPSVAPRYRMRHVAGVRVFRPR